ncbi:hypothetical protein Tco_0180572 [Tanacetum coccineum]
MYALTTNPTIYDSLVKKFWQTATANTLTDGTLELHATIDTIVYTITEASIRNKLRLADASGITMLPNNEIFEGMGHMGSKSGGWDQFGSNIVTALICLSTGRVYNFSKLIFDGMVANLKRKTKFLMYPRFLQLILDIQTENKHPYLVVTLTKKILRNMKRGFRGVPRPLLPAMLSIANPSAGQEAPSVTQPQPSSSVVPRTPPTTQPIPSEATTIPPLSQPAPPTPIAETTNASPSPTPSPAHEPMEHTFEQPSFDQQPPSPRQEATASQLMAQIDDLEKQLKETKQTFRKVVLTLVERVKSLEVALKRKTKRVLLSDSEEGETEAQGKKFHDLDPLVSLLQELVTPSKTPLKNVNASGEEQVEDISPTTLEAAAILTKNGTLEKEEEAKQVHLDSLLAQRLAEEEELNEQQKQRRAQVQFEAQHYTDEDWDLIRAKISLCRIVKAVLGSGDNKDADPISGTNINPVPVAIKPPSIATYKIIKQGKKIDVPTFRENGTDYSVQECHELMVRMDTEDELEKDFGNILKNMFEEPLSTDPLWSVLGQQRIISWRYYDAFRVHCLNLESMDIYMLIERKYPLSAKVCKAMLDMKLQGGKPDEDCYKLLKMMEKQAGIKK